MHWYPFINSMAIITVLVYLLVKISHLRSYLWTVQASLKMMNHRVNEYRKEDQIPFYAMPNIDASQPTPHSSTLVTTYLKFYRDEGYGTDLDFLKRIQSLADELKRDWRPVAVLNVTERHDHYVCGTEKVLSDQEG